MGAHVRRLEHGALLSYIFSDLHCILHIPAYTVYMDELSMLLSIVNLSTY